MNIKKIIYAWISKTFMGGCSNYNSLEVRRGCRSKQQARDKFQQGHIPYAKGLIFFNPFTAISFAKKYGFPLVIKPNVSGFSRGSHFPIRNYKELWKAIFLAKCWWPFTVVEQYLEGKNYRVVVANGEIISVLQRYAPSVKGDGKSTIRELMKKENTIREVMQLYPVISPLKETAQTRAFLKKQGFNFESVLESGQRVTLFYRISLAPGGVVEVINKQLLPEVNQALFKQVLNLFDANILGIDVILEKGIEFDYRAQKCIFLEVNSRPYLKMHAYPRYGQAEDLSSTLALLDALDIKQSDTF
ncbi:cyanophycin synthetase [Psychromonas sp. RZ22]|uniref:cyanophycin synthetase n=1 Tax=Psychromonas algarum TaxID=2555643 RepID=UPI0010679BFF|nr:cyanophycin synthetase [Psychromonas sp. RZ22]TEW53982.1 cyanophycin synthetase [Psychromonas sp. RZ22]